MAHKGPLKHIEKDLAKISANPPPGCQAGPVGHDYFHWSGTIMGPPGTHYEGGCFFLTIHWKTDHPFNPPKIQFTTKIYHVNVDAQGNLQGIDELVKPGWKLNMDSSAILSLLVEVMKKPRPEGLDRMFNRETVREFYEDRPMYDYHCMEWTEKYAK